MSTAEKTAALDCVPILSGGKWIELDGNRKEPVFNPSTGQAIAEVPICNADQTNDVVKAAADALDDWSETPVVERARMMFKFRQIMEERFDEIAALVTREHGKTLAESRAYDAQHRS